MSRYLAKKHMVDVIQFSPSKYDKIQPIYYGNFIDNLPETVYYEVTPFGIVYCLFHRKDWSNSKNWLIKKLDSHELDFEGVFKRIENGKVLWTCTRFHEELMFVRGDVRTVHIQSQGHGIQPGYPKKIRESFIYYPRDSFKFVNMATDRMKKITQKMYDISPVTSWDTWNNWKIERKFGKRTTGLIRTDPDKLFELAENRQIVKD